MNALGKLVLFFLLLGVIGFVVITVQKDSELHTLAQPPKEIKEGVYQLTLPKGGWYDPGIWVKDVTWIRAETIVGTPVQPFSIRIQSTVVSSNLDISSKNFGANIYTTNMPKSELANSGVRNFAVNVDNQDKILLKVNDEAVTDKLEIILDTNYGKAPPQTQKEKPPVNEEPIGKADMVRVTTKQEIKDRGLESKEWDFMVSNNGEWFDTGILITPSLMHNRWIWPLLEAKAELANTNLDWDFDVQIGERILKRRMAYGVENYKPSYRLNESHIGDTIKLKILPGCKEKEFAISVILRY